MTSSVTKIVRLSLLSYKPRISSHRALRKTTAVFGLVGENLQKAHFSQTTEENTGFALFGVGRIGQIHIGNLISSPRVQLKWIVEENSVLAKEVMTRHGLTGKVKLAGLGEMPKILADKSVDAVFICTPTDTHTDLAKQSLIAGKHVLCEKPISENTAEVFSCFETAEKCGKTLMATFNRQFDPSYRDIYNRVRSGELGKVQFIRSTFRDTPLWLGAHSISQTFLIHDIGILSWLTDSLPDSLMCMSAANIKEVADKDDVDSVVVTMKFPSGIIGIIDFCRYSCYGYDIRLEVCGTEGMLLMDTLKMSSVKTANTKGNFDAPVSVSFPHRFEMAYKIELEHFIDVIQGGAKLDIKREYSERAAIIMDAIRESYNTGQVVYLKK